MSGGIRIDGVREAIAALSRIELRLDAATLAATRAAAHQIEARTKKKLTTYSHRPGEPTPSPTGSPPALVTGTLRRSVKVTGPKWSGKGWQAEIGPTAVYSRIQELGGVTGRGSTLPPRPYLTPAFRELVANGDLGRTFRTAWRAAITG